MRVLETAVTNCPSKRTSRASIGPVLLPEIHCFILSAFPAPT
jgi:hypothetical protein